MERERREMEEKSDIEEGFFFFFLGGGGYRGKEREMEEIIRKANMQTVKYRPKKG